MTDYGRGGVLGAATILPATSAAGVYLLDKSQTWIIAGFIAVSFASLTLLAGYLCRFIFNRRIK